MHIYAFGSICRGEVELDSDIDLLALVAAHDGRLSPLKYSIYSYAKIKHLWYNGNPFAWHLALESRLLFASDNIDFLGTLGMPSKYSRCCQDCEKFFEVFRDARGSLSEGLASWIFDLSSVFLSIRNISTCFSLGVLDRPNFSRHSALSLEGEYQLPISSDCYKVLERSRILCTRGQGFGIDDEEMAAAISELDAVAGWMKKLVEGARENARIQ